ncbi:hypothetical protein IEQ34_010210 [Dendrobium chrysotoxum]|uniref:Uncharacterized protein n=1 Tax=Dendrobium chrysotoxum TaxID=161865 RepID=A0AAV7H549_DENCH|nr:hypothetical protein IEQ34_010210 [Dendrobium chrysotoxum]
MKVTFRIGNPQAHSILLLRWLKWTFYREIWVEERVWEVLAENMMTYRDELDNLQLQHPRNLISSHGLPPLEDPKKTEEFCN